MDEGNSGALSKAPILEGNLPDNKEKREGAQSGELQ